MILVRQDFTSKDFQTWNGTVLAIQALQACGEGGSAAQGKKAVVEALVPYEDFRLIQNLEDQIDHDEAEKVLAEAKAHGTTPWEQVKRELGL